MVGFGGDELFAIGGEDGDEGGRMASRELERDRLGDGGGIELDFEGVEVVGGGGAFEGEGSGDAAAGGEGEGDGGGGEVADAEAVAVVGAAFVVGVAELDEVLAVGGEGVGEAGICAQARGVVAIGELAAGAIEEANERIDAGVDAARDDFERDALAGVGGEAVVVAGEWVGLAFDGGGEGKRLRVLGRRVLRGAGGGGDVVMKRRRRLETLALVVTR